MFLNGVSVILCGSEQSFQGITVAWATQIEKNHLIVSLSSEASATEAILSNGQFSLSVLGATQSEVARQYGGSKQTRTPARREEDLDFGIFDTPVVKNARGQVMCRSVQDIKLNEQCLIIAEIVEARLYEDVPPLTYIHSEYFG